MSIPQDDQLLNIFYEIQNQPDPHEINKATKTIAFKHSSALNTTTNRNTCLVLNEHLKKCRIDKLLEDTTLKEKLTRRNLHRQCTLQDTDAGPSFTNLPCSQNFLCEQSEHVSEESFQDFMSLFNQGRNNDKSAPLETRRTVAKSFAPQTCNSRERHSFKPHREDKSDFNEENDEPCQSKELSSGISKDFKTAREEIGIQKKKQGVSSTNTGGQKRKLGTRRGVGSKFISPMLSNESTEGTSAKSQEWSEQIDDERLKNIEPRMVELIKSEIMDKGPKIHWDDVAGLEFAKVAIQEAVVWPMLRPDIFTGLRRPPKGILLFGPPGTGKTLIGKCVASQSKSTFFSISASSLTSKWIGDGEKMVRALFVVARCSQPAVIFIDEIDSLLSQRSESEHESSRRIKTEFLVQLDGATTDNEEKLLVIGATNRPQELDEAARRRFVKRLYIPLPETKARLDLVKQLMCAEKHELEEEDMIKIAELSEGYSGADMKNLCSDASMGPVRSLDIRLLQNIETTQVRPINMGDFTKAFARVKSSVSSKDLDQYVIWNKTYGSGCFS